MALCAPLVTAVAAAKDLSAITAEEKETARQLLDAGDALIAAGNVQKALEKYQAADEIMGVPTTGLEVGKALEKLGRLVEARDAYLRVIRYPNAEGEPSAFVEARGDADARAAALKPRIPSLTIQVPMPADAPPPAVTLDGKQVSAAIVGQPMSVDPGDHRVIVTAEGHLPGEATVQLREGGNESVTITLEADPNAPSPTPLPSRPVPIGSPVAEDSTFPVFTTMGFAIGGAGLILGAVTGGLSIAQTGDLADACTEDKTCPPEQQGAIDDAELLANVSNVGFAIGGAGVLFGVIALFTLDAEGAPVEAAGIELYPSVGPGSVSLRGRF